MKERYPWLFNKAEAEPEPPLRVTLSALAPSEYYEVVCRWPLADLYIWLIVRHAEHFTRTIDQAVRDMRAHLSPN